MVFKRVEIGEALASRIENPTHVIGRGTSSFERSTREGIAVELAIEGIQQKT